MEQADILIGQDNQLELKERISEAISVLNETPHWYSNIEDIKKRTDAEQAILSHGRKVLPLLLEHLDDGSEFSVYYFTHFLSALAEEEDINFTLQIMQREDVFENPDGSSLRHVQDTLQRILIDKRKENPTFKADDVAHTLISMLENRELGNEYELNNFYYSLILTKAEFVPGYIETHVSDDETRLLLLDYVNHPEKLDYLYTRQKFETFEEIQRMRLRSSSSRYRDSYYNDYDVEDYGITDNAIYNQDDIIRPYNETGSALIYTDSQDRIEELQTRVEDYLKDKPLPSSTLPAVKLFLFNVFRQLDTYETQDIDKAFRKMNSLIFREKEAMLEAKLPSIGMEIEVDGTVFTYNPDHYVTNLLKSFGLRIKEELSSTEIEFPPSYSSAIQARMIVELKKLGLIPDEKKFASLHINLGYTPEEYLKTGDEDLHMELAENISDLITFAFVPASRIRSRQNTTAYREKNDDPNIRPMKSSQKDILLEFRTPRVFLAKTYRLLSVTQQLGKIMYLDSNHPLIKQFQDATQQLRRKYSISSNEPENDPEHSAFKIEEAWQIRKRAIERNEDIPLNLIDESRTLIFSFILKIQKEQQLSSIFIGNSPS